MTEPEAAQKAAVEYQEPEPGSGLPKRSHPISGRVLAALISVQLLFGVHYVVSKILVTNIPPLVWAGVRAVITAILMVGCCFLFRRPHPAMSWKFFGPLLVFSALGVWLNQSLFLTGLSLTTSTNVAILNSLIPVFTLLLVTLRGQEEATGRRIFGFMSAFVGILILCRIEEFQFSDHTLRGDFFILLNCLCFASFLTFGKSFLEKYDHYWTTAWLFIFGAVALNVLAIPQWKTFEYPQMDSSLWLCVIYGIVGATFLTYLLNNYALSRVQASQVALLIYIQPIVASALAFFWLGETLSWRVLFAACFIFIGIFFSLWESRRERKLKQGQA